MERLALGVALALVLAGCSGVDIRPISPALEADAHARDGAASGYVVYALAPDWPFVFVGLVGVMAWRAGAFPTTFAVIGDSLPRDRRAVAFAIQSTLIRVPRVVGAPLGGLAIVSFGMLAGIRLAFALTIALALIVMVVQYYGFKDVQPPDDGRGRSRARTVHRPKADRR